MPPTLTPNPSKNFSLCTLFNHNLLHISILHPTSSLSIQQDISERLKEQRNKNRESRSPRWGPHKRRERNLFGGRLKRQQRSAFPASAYSQHSYGIYIVSPTWSVPEIAQLSVIYSWPAATFKGLWRRVSKQEIMQKRPIKWSRGQSVFPMKGRLPTCFNFGTWVVGQDMVKRKTRFRYTEIMNGTERRKVPEIRTISSKDQR